MSDKLDSITKKITEMAEQTTADYKQIQGLVHQRNVFYATIKQCQEICARYILPDSKLTAEKAMIELVGILDNRNLIKEMQK